MGDRATHAPRPDPPREDRKKHWWTIVETRVIATPHTTQPNPDDRFLQAAMQAATLEMTNHFDTSKWNLEGLSSNTYEVDQRTYVTVILVASVGPQ